PRMPAERYAAAAIRSQTEAAGSLRRSVRHQRAGDSERRPPPPPRPSIPLPLDPNRNVSAALASFCAPAIRCRRNITRKIGVMPTDDAQVGGQAAERDGIWSVNREGLQAIAPINSPPTAISFGCLLCRRKELERAGVYTEKYFAWGWWTTIAEVDCSGSS